ncbi:uncharacterized protein K452DRAFT_303028 [Aplosporella prunicola CBS 121167]|uniref:DUF1275 domain protein n=1 Tax=Aplosporella prunicola CBS 121167 TaxID=1176127 RepID=A0A6A6AVQ7_9PEZI|nr:uncharacterized protein K452DRAFT_303028 [Aplosporella prunicola CBS 121167]KAF2136092.1 hypothetical protein K452DRAFT_303028 [Aplosporella prunicola CBS 121167]
MSTKSLDISRRPSTSVTDAEKIDVSRRPSTSATDTEKIDISRRPSTAATDTDRKLEFVTPDSVSSCTGTVSPAALEAQTQLPYSDPDEELRNLPFAQRWAGYLKQEIAIDSLLEMELYILTFATGIQDAMTFAFFGVFCSKQTGNLVNFALSALESHAVLQTEANIAVSFCCFILGAAIFGHFNNFVGKKRRGWLMFVNAWQTALILSATGVRYWSLNHGIQDSGADPSALACIALLALASGGQISLALSVGMPEVNTTMVTGAIVMLAHDKKLITVRNPGRNRKVFFILSLLAGSFMGAICNRFSSSVVSLLLVGIVKFTVTFLFLANKGVKKHPGSTEKTESSVNILQILWGD